MNHTFFQTNIMKYISLQETDMNSSDIMNNSTVSETSIDMQHDAQGGASCPACAEAPAQATEHAHTRTARAAVRSTGMATDARNSLRAAGRTRARAGVTVTATAAPSVRPRSRLGDADKTVIRTSP